MQTPQNACRLSAECRITGTQTNVYFHSSRPASSRACVFLFALKPSLDSHSHKFDESNCLAFLVPQGRERQRIILGDKPPTPHFPHLRLHASKHREKHCAVVPYLHAGMLFCCSPLITLITLITPITLGSVRRANFGRRFRFSRPHCVLSSSVCFRALFSLSLQRFAVESISISITRINIKRFQMNVYIHKAKQSPVDVS